MCLSKEDVGGVSGLVLVCNFYHNFLWINNICFLLTSRLTTSPFIGRKHHVSQGVNLLCREGNSQPGHMQRRWAGCILPSWLLDRM